MKASFERRRWNHTLILLTKPAIPVIGDEIVYAISQELWYDFENIKYGPHPSQVPTYFEHRIAPLIILFTIDEYNALQ